MQPKRLIKIEILRFQQIKGDILPFMKYPLRKISNSQQSER